MSLQNELNKANELHDFVRMTLSELECPGDERSHLALACFDTVMEHQEGICLLLGRQPNGLCAPAFALARPVQETFVRGHWIRVSASDEEFTNYKNDEALPPLGKMIEKLETRDEFSSGILTRSKTAWFGLLSSFTHGGIKQSMRRIGDGILAPQYSPEEQIEMLRMVTSYMLLAGLAVAGMADRADLAQNILEKAENYAKDS